MYYLEKLSALISKYMAVLVIAIAAIALIEPMSFKWAAPNITMLLGIVMFGMGMTLKLADFKLVFQRPRDVFIGALAQFTIMPLLAYFLATAFGLPPELAAGVILVGTCPGGTSSNVMTYLARGDVALSVSMTMTTTVLAPIVTPLLTWWPAGAEALRTSTATTGWAPWWAPPGPSSWPKCGRKCPTPSCWCPATGPRAAPPRM